MWLSLFMYFCLFYNYSLNTYYGPRLVLDLGFWRMNEYTHCPCPHFFLKSEGEVDLNQITTQMRIKLQLELVLQKRAMSYMAHSGGCDVPREGRGWKTKEASPRKGCLSRDLRKDEEGKNLPSRSTALTLLEASFRSLFWLCASAVGTETRIYSKS